MKTFSKEAGSERLRKISCALCGGSRFRRWNGSDSLFVKCFDCGLIFQNPQPVQVELVDRYDEEYFAYETENEKQFFNLMELGLADVDFDSIERSLPPQRSFLDIGCATGMLIARMKERGWREQGVEVCRPAAEFGMRERGLRISVGTLEEARFPEGAFDVVHCSHLIEHLTNPRGFLEEIRRILAPKGYFIVTTPNADGFQARLFGREWRSMIDDHMYLFTRRTLRRLIEDSGFRVVRGKTWGGLAVGTAAKPIKDFVDRTAKRLNFGDVMIYLCQRREESYGTERENGA